MKPQKIYLALTVRGSREKIQLLQTVSMFLESRGHKVLTKHLLAPTAPVEESQKTSEFVFNRDMKWLKECDVLIAEVSGSSFGVGFETGFTLGEGKKKVYVLYDASLQDSISKVATGLKHKNCTMFGYNNISEVREFIGKNF